MVKIPKSLRVISMTLILALFVQILPMDVFAEPPVSDDLVSESDSAEIEQEYVNVFEADDDSSSEISDSEIVTELKDKREENTKYFLLSDGTIAAAVYNNAVHELDENGKWQDIDNTLSLEEDVLSEEETTEDANDDESTLDNETSTNVIVSDSSLSVLKDFSESFDIITKSVSRSDMLSPKRSSGSAKKEKDKQSSKSDKTASQKDTKTDNQIKSAKSDDNAIYEKSHDDLKIQFSKKAKESKLLSIQTDDYKIEWGLKNVASKVKQANLSKIKNKKGYQKTATKSVSGVLEYDNVMSNVDLTYQLVGNDIKENIVLNKAGSARDFEFSLKCNKLTPTLEDNRILLKDRKNKIVYTIDAPYMVDALDVYSGDVKLELTADKKGKSYTVKLIPDKDWLNSSERAYPVIIDPTISKSYNKNNVDNTSVTSKRPTSSEMYQYGVMYVGRESSSYEKLRGLFKFTLPTEITESDMIIDAYITLTQRNYFGSGSVVVNAYKMTSDVALKSATWNTVNGKYNSNVLDTQTVSSSTKGNHIKFDITAAVREWYLSGNNYGLALVSENETGAYKYATFYSARYPDIATANLPAITVTYRNHDGIEDYLTYHEMGSDSMGTAYVGDFNGNMIYTFNDVSTDGNYMPLSISHVYNHSQRASANLTGGDMRFGYGMRLNLSQRIVAAGITGYSYKWTDEDGTVHYFKQSSDNSSKHEEEFDTGRTITVNSDNTFTLNDRDSEFRIFNSSGYLIQISDINPQEVTEPNQHDTLTITYSGTKITKVTDGAGRVATFTYNSSNYLTSIKDPAGRITSYTYSSGYLTKITNPDGTSVSYTYATDGSNKILTKITDIDGSAVAFSYNTASPRRVKTVTEYGTAGTQGDKLTYTYNAGETKITDVSGRSETVMFDNYGHTVCVRDGQGNAVYGSYNNSSDNKQHTLKYQSNMQSSVTNYLLNHDFEYSALAPWVNYSNTTNGTGTAALTSAEKCMGSKSMQIKSTGSSGRYGYMQPLTLTNVAGATYTFSGYVKISSITAASSANAGLLIAFSYKDTDGTWHLDRREFIKTTCDWQRVSYTLTFPQNLADNYFRIVLGFENATGTAYFDDCQLEQGAVANRYNLLDNGHFSESTGKSTVKSWTGQNLNTTNDVTVAGRSGSGYKITGESKYKNIEQTVNVSGGQGDSFVFGAWGKANAIAKVNKNGGNARDFAVRITFTNSDNTTTKYYFDFEAKTANWQYLSGTVSAPQTYKNVKIALLYNNQRNFAVFDDVQLYHEAFGTKYTYDSLGRVTTEIDAIGQKTVYEYCNAKWDDVKKVSYYRTDGSLLGTESYVYDSKRHVTQYTDIDGLVTTYEYDTNGILKDAKQTADSKTISSDTVIQGNYASSSTDNLGHTITYHYNANTGVLNSVTNAKGHATDYNYNPYNDNLLSVTANGSQNTYTYSYNNVSTIKHNTSGNSTGDVTYHFTYDEFGNVTNVKVGNVSLMRYQYNANNGSLKKSIYGNEDYVENVYDNLDRVTAVKYNGAVKYRWSYGADGNVGQHTDLVNNVKWQYQYDIGGNVTSVYGNNGTSFNYTYGTDGTLTKDVVKVGSVSKGTTYGYTTKGTLNKITYGNGSVMTYTYDGFKRTTKAALTKSSTQALATSYSYLAAATSGETTDIVSGMTNSGSGWSQTLNYTYDKNGNIETVKEGSTQKVKYEYDALNQLVRENNAWLNKTIAYTYDMGGNIQTVKEYALTSGALDGLTATKTYTYLYGDSNWKDKLTSYNGQSITYDAIGNPLTYYNGIKFVWQNGRELASLTTSSGTGVTYTYDSDGIRMSKKVGSVTTNYTLEGSNVIYETNGTDNLWYYYDTGGNPVSFELNGISYHYVKNLQGDIIAIVNDSGAKVVEYKYDSWGKLISTTGSLASTVGVKNPYRYRGYRYDNETGLYYLQSRYYDPQIGRFINADSYVDTGDTVLSTNMFAYCENDAVNCVDYSGGAKVRYPNTVIGKSTVEPISDIVLSAIKSKKVFKNALFSYSSATSLQYTKDYHFVITMKKNKNGSIDIIEVIYRVKYATTSNFEASLMRSYKGYFNFVNNFVNNDSVGFAFSAYSDAGGDPRIVFAYNALYIAVNQKILAPKEVRLYYAAKKKGGKMIALVMSYNVVAYTKTKGGKKINYTQVTYKKYF